MAHFFYQNRNLITLKIDGHFRSLIRSTKHLFAELRTERPQTPKLLATDTNNSVMSTHDSTQQEDYAYAAFGHSADLPSNWTSQGFNGEFINNLLNAYQLGLGYRAYSPGLMRFQSPDSLSPFEKGGINCYTYCGGDPVNYTDPTGHALVHLKNGQTMRVTKNSAVALPHKFKPSTLKRTTSHASALKSETPRYPTTSGAANPFNKITEPDIFESIISNLSYQDAVVFSKASESINAFAEPIIKRYTQRITTSDQTMNAARTGTLPGVPGNFSSSIVPRLDMLADINRIETLGGASNFLRLIRHGRQEARLNARRERRDSLDDLIVDAD